VCQVICTRCCSCVRIVALYRFYFFFFFFQAEDGIRDSSVTGVQTCALPILMAAAWGSSARIVSPMARTVPELPAQVSQPRRRKVACTGSSSRRAARRARSKRLAEILPDRKSVG